MSASAAKEAPGGALGACCGHESGGSSCGPRASWFSAIAGGLLSSSCCALQLLLNLLASLNILHVGCAGFNTVLGPARPMLRGMTLLVLAQLWYQEVTRVTLQQEREEKRGQEDTKEISSIHVPPATRAVHPCHRSRSRVVLFLQTCLCLSLMFLPEALRAVSKMKSQSRQSLPSHQSGSGLARAISSFLLTESVLEPSASFLSRPGGGGAAVWKHYEVRGMGCEACATHVQGVVAECKGVVEVNDLVFEEGILSILVQPDLGFDEDTLKNQLFLDGYELDAINTSCSSGCISSDKTCDNSCKSCSPSFGSGNENAAEIWSGVRVSTFRLMPGMDLKQELQDFARRHGMRAGSVVSCVGSLQRATLRLATGQDGSMKVLEVEQFFEITSLSGTVAYERGGESGAEGDGVKEQFHLHLHMTLCDAEGRCLGGHVLPGNIIFTTAEITILDASSAPSCSDGRGSVRFTRKHDAATGFRELVVLPQ